MPYPSISLSIANENLLRGCSILTILDIGHHRVDNLDYFTRHTPENMGTSDAQNLSITGSNQKSHHFDFQGYTNVEIILKDLSYFD